MPDPAWALQAQDLQVAAIDVGTILVLRLRRAGETEIDRFGVTLGTPLPNTPNWVTGQSPRVAWLAPGDWMIVGRGAERATHGLAAVSCLGHVADVTHGRSVFAISGANARTLLAKGTSVDLHARAFGADRCAQTLFAQARVLIDRIGENTLFHLYADRSYEGHLRAWFAENLKEFEREGFGR